MNRKEIDKALTEIVQKYIVEGYVINTYSMKGSEGEEGKVDLVKGDRLIRVWVSRETLTKVFNEKVWNGDYLVLQVGVWKYSADLSYRNTVWMSDFNVIEIHRFYEIVRDSWYTQDLDEALEIQDKRLNRYRRNFDRRFDCVSTRHEDDTARTIATRYLKNKAGYKRVSWDKLRVEKMMIDNGVTFMIIYNDNRFILN